MMGKLYHQCGHNTNWNLDSFMKDNCGDGLIFSPVHKKLSDLEKITEAVKVESIFDPQFYLPNSQKAKLKTYSFYPETISPDSFSTQDFTLVAFEAAKLCIDFQVKNTFKQIIIPTRYFDQMYPDFIERQNIFSVHPFLKAISMKKVKKPVYLTLALTSHMILSKPYRTQLLNWATSFPEIDGIYLIAVPHDENLKQIQSQEFLFGYMDFIQQLRKANLEVLVGYCNTEGLLYLLIEGCDITFGTFENTRIFSTDKFVISEEERRGPKARIFLGGLLNWIQINQAKEILGEHSTLWERIYDPTSYGDRALNAPVEPTFNQPHLYKHHFKIFSKLANRIRALPLEERYKEIRICLKDAQEFYEEISELPIDLDKHSKGAHIQPWLDTLNEFYRLHIKPNKG